MDHDRAFLDAIFEKPDDVSLRLVYADWLEERGDVRSELVRIRSKLAALQPHDPQREQLLQRDRELARACDEEWLILLERAAWKRRYRSLLKPIRKHKPRWSTRSQRGTSEAILAFETTSGLKLPRSYKAYAHVFGHGEMARFFRIKVPNCPNARYELAHFNREFHETAAADDRFEGEHAWLRQAIFFAATIGGEPVAWDTAVVTDPETHEYRICWLWRSFEILRMVNSFPEFIDEVCLKAFEDEGVDTPQVFQPY